MKKKQDSVSFSVDVLSYHLIPEVSVLSTSEKKKILSQYSITERQLPRILVSDPLVTTLKAVEGDILKIKRNDGTGVCTGYRIVVQ